MALVSVIYSSTKQPLEISSLYLTISFEIKQTKALHTFNAKNVTQQRKIDKIRLDFKSYDKFGAKKKRLYYAESINNCVNTGGTSFLFCFRNLHFNIVKITFDLQ